MGGQDVLQLSGHLRLQCDIHGWIFGSVYEDDDNAAAAAAADDDDYDDDVSFEGRGASLLDYGVPTWRRPYDSSNEEGS